MKRKLCLLLCLLMLPLAAWGEEPLPPREYDFTHKAARAYDSESLKYKLETFTVKRVRCYLVKLWMRDPGKQIQKATSAWRENIMLPADMAKTVPGAILAINGSGYWSPVYPDVPPEYPGDVSDYFYTPWGSLTVTDGEVFRDLPEIPYTGLTLEADGLHMYVAEPTEKVLSANPTQTWSFRDFCPMQRAGEDLLPEDWNFAGVKARRTIIGKVDQNNYLILSVSNDGGAGLTLYEANDFFHKYFELEWLYDLDGGPSSAMFSRKQGASKLSRVVGGAAKDLDMMVFVELPEEE